MRLIILADLTQPLPKRNNWKVALDLYERNEKDYYQYRDELYSIRDRLLKEVRSRRFYVLYLFFLTSVKPFYFVSYLHLFRRYYNAITKKIVALDKIVRF